MHRTWILALLASLTVACEEAAGEGSPTDATGSTGGDTRADTEGTGDACPDVIADGSFEEGPLGEAWMVGSANFETPICNAACYAGVSQAFDGQWWVWFGGVPVPESAFVAQTVPLISGRAVLHFQLRMQADEPSAGDTLTVVVDGQGVQTISAVDAGLYGEYTEVAVDLGAFADNATHVVSLDANFTAMTTTSFFVDLVELQTCP